MKIRTGLKQLFIGKQSLKQRTLTALCPALALTFTLFLFGPLDLSHIAAAYVDYTVPEILPYTLRIWGILFLCIFIPAWIIGGKLHAWLTSFLAELAAALYIQGNWLSTDLGTLNGETVNWEAYGDNALVNLVIFTAIVLIPLLIHFFSRRVWKTYIIFTSLLLTVMQLVPLTLSVIEEYRNRPETSVRYIVAKDREYTLGKENIVVFILDFTGPDQISHTLEKYPDALAPFHDFLCFDNYNTEYVGTFPSAAYLFTHQPYDREIPYSQWFRNVWHSDEAESFYAQLKSAGWTTRAFHNTRMVAGNAENEYGKIDNVIKVEEPPQYTIDPSIYRKLIKLSFYRYFPLIMKAPFRIYTDDLNGMKTLSENERSWNKYNSLQKYLDQRLTVGDEARVYITYHYAGAHSPADIDQTGRFAKTAATTADQLAGHFFVISEYIQQMKDYHVYDSSTVIITTDHGTFTNPHGILYIKPAGQRQNEMTYNHAPVSQSEFMESIAEFAGLEKGQFGRSFYDVSEDEERLRCTALYWKDPDLPEKPGKSSNAIRTLCYIGDDQTVSRMIADKEYESLPLEYPFY